MAHEPAASAPRIAAWQFQRGGEPFRFEMQLDASDFTEKLILDTFDARQFYEPELSGLMLKALQKGDTVIDAGANCGYFTLLAAALVGAGGHVLSIEAAPECVTRLKSNIARNRFAHVGVVERVATNRAGSATFHINRDNSGGHALWDPGEFPDNHKSRAAPMTLTLPATTLDAEWKARNLPLPKLIKIDTEGAEQFVLEGARELLSGAKAPLVVVELQEFGLQKLGCSQLSLRRVMEGYGYSAFGLYYSGALPKLIPPGTEIKSPYVLNLLFATPATIGRYWPATAHDPRNPG